MDGIGGQMSNLIERLRELEFEDRWEVDVTVTSYERKIWAMSSELLELWEAAKAVDEQLAPCRENVPGVYYHGPCPICELRANLTTLNARAAEVMGEE
jgi:hypothetical protein